MAVAPRLLLWATGSRAPSPGCFSSLAVPSVRWWAETKVRMVPVSRLARMVR